MIKTYRIGSGKVISTMPQKGGAPEKDDFHCVVCGREIDGSYYIDNYGNKACAIHGDDIRRCKDCGRIMSNEESVFINGLEWHCSFCHNDSVKDEAGARNIFNELISEYKVIGITGFDESTKIRLVTQSEGWVGRTVSSYDGCSYSFEILMLSPTHRLVFKSTLAHEMLHTWVRINNIKTESSSVEEGFCNLGTAWVLEKSHSEIGRMWLENMEKDYDLRYGQGYRVMKNKLNKLGWKGLIASLRP